jgi:hypothetical protein
MYDVPSSRLRSELKPAGYPLKVIRMAKEEKTILG